MRSVKTLLKQLSSANEFERREAAGALEYVPRDTSGIVPALLKALQDEYVIVRREAAYTLSRMVGALTVEAVPELIQALGDEDDFAWWAVRAALVCVGEAAVPHLGIVLQDESVDLCLRMRLPGTLGRIGTASVPTLIAALEHADWGIASEAAEALYTMSPPPMEAIPALRVALKHDYQFVRIPAASALASALEKLGPQAVEAIPELIDALEDEQPSVQSSAARALGTMGPLAADAVPALVAALADAYGPAQNATVALARIGAAAVPVLLAAEEHVRLRYLDILESKVRYGASGRDGMSGWLKQTGPTVLKLFQEKLAKPEPGAPEPDAIATLPSLFEVMYPEIHAALVVLLKKNRRSMLLRLEAFYAVAQLHSKRKASIALGTTKQAVGGGEHGRVDYHIGELEKALGCQLIRTVVGERAMRSEPTTVGCALRQWIAENPEWARQAITLKPDES